MNVLGYTRAEFLRRKSFKTNTFLSVVGIFIVVAIQMAVWTSVNSTAFQSSQLIIYAIVSRILLTLFPDHRVTNEVADVISNGKIGIYLLRPHHFISMQLAKQIGSLLYDLIFLLCPLVICLSLYAYFMQIDLLVHTFVLFAFSSVLGIGISFLLGYVMGLLAIKFTHILGVLEFYDALLIVFGGSTLPIAMFPEWMQAIIQFTPFYAMLYTPTSIISEISQSEHLIGLLSHQIIWLVLLLGVTIIYQRKIFYDLNYFGG